MAAGCLFDLPTRLCLFFSGPAAYPSSWNFSDARRPSAQDVCERQT